LENYWVVLPDLVLKVDEKVTTKFWISDHDQIVFGDDGLSYKYNSFSGNWTGNEMMLVTEPCLKNRITAWQPPLKEIDALKAKTANKNEAGIVQKAGTFVDMITYRNELNMPPGTDFIGSMHTHQTLIQVVGFGRNGT
jgi:hypothetical protein